eukprot:m.167592 g.167592  ORF g.167592 m.167592 type:complete len:821 (+) comp17196_c0_seq2:270-2732(+)
MTTSFARSSDIAINASVLLRRLEGSRERRPASSLRADPSIRFSGLYKQISDVFVTVQIVSDGVPLTIPRQTTYVPFSTDWTWNEWIDLPVSYQNLPRNARILLTVWDVYSPGRQLAVGTAAIDLFDSDGVLRRGEMTLRVTPAEDSGDALQKSGDIGSSKTNNGADGLHEVERMEQLYRKYQENEIPHIDWLDRVTLRKVEALKKVEKAATKDMHITIELPQFKCPVVYCERAVEVTVINGGVRTIDPELLNTENLVEDKHHKLTRCQRRGPSERELKPNPAIRDLLLQITRRVFTVPLKPEEKDLIWLYRYYLRNDKKALTKFLRSVKFDEKEEACRAIDLMQKWEPIDVDDALELLSPSFQNPSVRAYALLQLEKADDDELLSYLLQLVQALNYDPESLRGGPSESTASSSRDSQSLEAFLIKRALHSAKLAHYLYWYLKVESTEKSVFKRVFQAYIFALETGSDKHRELYADFRRQDDLIEYMQKMLLECKNSPAPRPKKIEALRAGIQSSEIYNNFEPRSLPLDPTVRVTGFSADHATVFKSAMQPLGLGLKTEVAGVTYDIIFKMGDDLRQDQLIIQLFTLMDRLLKKDNLDLRLTPYHVLATSATAGMVQKIESRAVAHILSEYGSIQNYFKKVSSQEDGTDKINKDIMDTYVRSCAGYCVITYLLGVGDRHLDNLLITKDGRLFHIDFGYILGRDPKPYPPPFKLNKDMVEGMGGSGSDEMKRFRSHCYNAFLILRRHANLVLNLFALMVQSSIHDIALDPDKTVIKVQEKFRLDLSEEKAVQRFQELIDESINAVMASIVERVHTIAQYWRK